MTKTNEFRSHPKYIDVFDDWFCMHPQARAMREEQERLLSIPCPDGATAAQMLERVIILNERRRQCEADYEALKARLLVQFDHECADLRERFEACRFPVV